MATLRELTPTAGAASLTALTPTAPGLREELPLNYGPDLRQIDAQIARDSMTQTGLGYKSSRLGDQANWMEVEAATREAAGDVQGAQTLRGQINGLRQQAAYYAPAEQDITKVGLNPGRILDYGLGAVGSMGASMQDGLLAGGAVRGAGALLKQSNNPLVKGAGLAAAFVPNLLSNSGEQLGSYQEDKNIMSTTTAGERLARGLGTGAVMGALDTLPEAGILSRVAGKGVGAGILRNTAMDVGKEAATEVAQTGVQKLDLNLLNPNRDGSEDWRDYANAAAQAGLGSTPMHGASNVLGAMGNRIAEPGDPGVVKGDEIDLKTGKKLDGSLASLDEQLQHVGGEKYKADYEAKKARSSVLDGTAFDDAMTHEEMTAGAEERRAALIEELTKAGDRKSAGFAEKLAAMSTEDLMLDPEVDKIAHHIIPKAGLDADSLKRIADGFKNKRPKNNERNFLPGEANPESVGGLVDTSKMASVDPKKFAEQKAAFDEMTTRGKTAARLIEDSVTGGGDDARLPASQRGMLRDIGQELAAMASVKGKPAPGELFRAGRLGRIVGSMLGEEKVTTALEQAGKASGAWGTPLFSAFLGNAVRASGKLTKQTVEEERMSRNDAATQLMALVPADKEHALAKRGINLRNESLQHWLLDGMQDMFDGDETRVSEKKAVEMFGAEAVEGMRELLGKRIEMRMPGEKLGTEGQKSEKLSSDDVTKDFDKEAAQRGVDKAPATSIIFGRGMSERGGISVTDMFHKKKGRELPSMIHMPEGASKEQATQQRGTLAAIFRAVKNAPGIRALEDVRSGHSISTRKVLDLMNEQGLPEAHREALMREYLMKDHARVVEARAKEIAEERGWSKKKAREAAHQEANDDNSPLGQLGVSVRREAHLSKLVAALNARVEANTPNTRARLTQLVEGADATTKMLLAKVAKQVKANELKNQGATPEAVFSAKTARDATAADGGTGADANDAAVEALKFVLGAPTDKLSMAAKAVTELLAETKVAAANAVGAAAPGGTKQYFGERHVVVAARRDAWDNKDHLSMTHTEFKDMIAAAKPALDAARKLADPVAANKQLSEEGVLFIAIAGEDDGAPAAIKAKHIVAWARGGEFASTTTDDKVKSRASDRAKRREYISLLVQGISEMMRQQFIAAMPAVLSPDGEYQTFSEPRKAKEVEADRARELEDAEDDFEVDKINRKYDAELKLKGLPPSLMLDNGQTAEQFVMSGHARGVEEYTDQLLVSARKAGVKGNTDADRIVASIEAARRTAIDKENNLHNERMGRTDPVAAEQRRLDYREAQRDQTAPITEDGFWFGDPSEDGTQADVNAQEHAVRTKAILGSADFANAKYNKDSAPMDAKRVGAELWQQWVMKPAEGFARITAIAHSLSNLEPWHAYPLAALVAEARTGKRPEAMSEKDKKGLDLVASKVASVALTSIRPSINRGKLITMLSGVSFDKTDVGTAWLEKKATAYEKMVAERAAKAPTTTPLTPEQREERDAANSVGPRLAPVQQKADPAKVGKATATEKRVQSLEAERSGIEARLAELQKVTGPIAEAKAEGEAVRDAAAYASNIVDADNAKTAGAMFVGTDPRSPTRSTGVTTSKPLTSAQVRAARVAAKAAHEAKLAEARAKYKALVDAVGKAELRKIRQEMDGLIGRKKAINDELAEIEARVGKAEPTTQAPAPKPTGLAALPDHKPGQKTMRYAGVGSRRTPPEMAARMTKVAKWLAGQGYTLFSGGADGADKAFEAGATTKEIFRANDATPAMVAVAKEVHPRPEALGDYALKLMARNTAQVFGRDLNNPVDFVLAWTPDGAESTADRNINTGGTGQAIDLASRKGVPVINLAREGWEARLKAAVMGQAQPVAEKPASKPITRAALAAEKAGTKLNERTFPGAVPAQNADTAKNGQERKNTETQATPSEADIDAVKAQIGRLLGPKIKVLFKEVMQGNGSWDDVTKIVTIALAPLAQMKSVAHHEAMHAFFSEGLKDYPEVKEMLQKAMAEPRIAERLQYLLRDSPKALKAIERDPEEAVAYAFEFWTEGLLDMGKAPATFFEKVQRFIRGVFGMIADSERALEIFQGLYDGKMADPSAAETAIQAAMERGEGLRAKALAMDKQARWVKTRIMAANRVVAETGPVGKALADMWFVNPGSTQQGTEPGVMNRRQLETNKRMNRLMTEVFNGLSDQDMKDLNEAAALKKKPEEVDNQRVAKSLANLYKLNADMYRYVTGAGVQIGTRDEGTYTPMVWNQQYMIEHKDKFVAMLMEHYPQMLEAARATAGQVAAKNLEPQDVAEHMWQAIIDRTGVDAKMDAQREDGVLSPFFASENGRSFDWIAPEHRKEFLSTDLVHTMTAYIHQAVRSAEYVRTFGVGGSTLSGMLERVDDVQGVNKDGTPKRATMDGPLIKEIRAKAIAEGVPPEKLEAYVLRRHDAVRDSVGAMEGVLGKDISDRARKVNSYLMTYQHLRLLPLSLFAAMLDPIGILVSGGKLDDAIGAYVRGMKGVIKTWKSMATGIPLTMDGDEAEMNALLVGTLDSNMFLEGMGDAHTSEYMDSGVRKVNHAFFKLNGLTAWDRNMRIAATGAAINFITAHDKNANPQHSARWMDGLGLKQGEVIYGADGKMVLDSRVLAQQRAESKAGGAEKFAALAEDKRQALVDGETRVAEQYMSKLHFGIQRFVQRGVLSPNAAVRPAWASDPHYAALFHLKQYTYGFHEIIMRHVKEEAMAGNYGPGLMALTGVPVMIASDITKGLLTGGGSLPGYMANWGLADWLTHGWARAGLNGIGQIGLDAVHSPASLLGPTADQVWQTAWDPLGKLEKLDMVPGARIVKGAADKLVGAMTD